MQAQGRVGLKPGRGRSAGLRPTRRSFLRATVSASMAATLCAPNIRPASAAELPDFEEVAEGAFVRFGLQEEITAANDGAIANIGFVVGDRTVAVIDSGTDRRQGEAVLKAIAAATDKPVSHLIATHVHQDHCFGHIAFADMNLHNIGHRNLPRALASRGPYYLKELAGISPDLGDAGYLVPTETVSTTRSIDLGNRTLVLEAWPTAHTDTDLTVFDQRTATLFTGDLLFAGRLPTLDGSLIGWLSVLDTLIGPEVRRVVPGHGPVGDGHAALNAERRYLTRLRDDVRKAIDDQLDIDGALARLKSGNRKGWLLFDGNHGRNIVTAYTELEWE